MQVRRAAPGGPERLGRKGQPSRGQARGQYGGTQQVDSVPTPSGVHQPAVPASPAAEQSGRTSEPLSENLLFLKPPPPPRDAPGVSRREALTSRTTAPRVHQGSQRAEGQRPSPSLGAPYGDTNPCGFGPRGPQGCPVCTWLTLQTGSLRPTEAGAAPGVVRSVTRAEPREEGSCLHHAVPCHAVPCHAVPLSRLALAPFLLPWRCPAQRSPLRVQGPVREHPHTRSTGPLGLPSPAPGQRTLSLPQPRVCLHRGAQATVCPPGTHSCRTSSRLVNLRAMLQLSSDPSVPFGSQWKGRSPRQCGHLLAPSAFSCP